MFKRLFWLTLGFGSGLGTSWYVVRSVKKTVRRTVATYAPAELATRAGDGMRDLRSSFRAALVEGRVAMHEREAELRARIEAHRLGAATRAATNHDAARAAAPRDRAPRDEAPVEAPLPGLPDAVDSGAFVPDELAARRNRIVPRPAGRARSGR